MLNLHAAHRSAKSSVPREAGSASARRRQRLHAASAAPLQHGLRQVQGAVQHSARPYCKAREVALLTWPSNGPALRVAVSPSHCPAALQLAWRTQ